MSYSLNPKRKITHLVIDDTDEVGREGIYGGSYDDCIAYVSEMAKHSLSIGIKIIPNS